MTKDDLLALLDGLSDPATAPDGELAHINADEALLAYLDDQEIRQSYEAVTRWYS